MSQPLAASSASGPSPAPASATPAPAATTTAAATPIRFRAEPKGAGEDIGQVFLLLVVLLAAFVAALLFARKQGWLARWGLVPAASGTIAAERPLRMEQALRLSAKSTLYRVRDEDRTILILESNGSAQVVEDARQGQAPA